MLLGLELVNKHVDVNVKTSWLPASHSNFNKVHTKDAVHDPWPAVGAARRRLQTVALQTDTLKSRAINIEWANMQKFLRVILVALCVPMLVSCGGEVWDEPGVVSVTVTAAPGMTGLELELRSPGLFFAESLSIPSAGRYTFSRFLAPNSSSFWVVVTTQPVNGECTVVDQQGIIFSTKSFKWTVNCRITQTISWSQNYTPSGGTASLTATASSGLPVSFVDRTSAPAVSGCTLVGNQLTYLSAGASCTIAAIQAGSDDYFPATEISQVFVNPL